MIVEAHLILLWYAIHQMKSKLLYFYHKIEVFWIPSIFILGILFVKNYNKYDKNYKIQHDWCNIWYS